MQGAGCRGQGAGCRGQGAGVVDKKPIIKVRHLDKNGTNKYRLISMGNFDKMEVWIESKDLAIIIYHLTKGGKFTYDLSFRDQLRRSAISVPSNLAEGEESIFDRVSIRFFSIASASLAELRTQFEIAHEVGYISDVEYHETIKTMLRLARRINKLIQYRQKHIR